MSDATTPPAAATPVAVPPSVTRMKAALDKLALMETPPTAPAPAAEPPKPAEAPPDEKLQRAIEQEKKLNALRDQAKAERLKLEEERKTLDDLKRRRDLYSKDPASFLRDVFPGIDPLKAVELLGQSVIGQAAPELQVSAVKDEAAEARAAVEALRQELAEKDKKTQEEEYNRAVADFKADVKAFVDEHKDAYELTDLYGQHDLVFKAVEDEYKATGKELSLKDAAEKVEKFLEEQASKAFTAKKFAERLKALKSGAPVPSLGAASPTPPAPATGKMTRDERLKRAIAAIPD